MIRGGEQSNRKHEREHQISGGDYYPPHSTNTNDIIVKLQPQMKKTSREPKNKKLNSFLRSNLPK